MWSYLTETSAEATSVLIIQQDSALPQQQLAHGHHPIPHDDMFQSIGAKAACTTWRRMLYMDLLIFHSSWQAKTSREQHTTDDVQDTLSWMLL